MTWIPRGAEVEVILTRCGPPDGREVGRIRGLTLHEDRGGELDVLIHPAEDLEEVQYTLDAEGSGLSLVDLQEGPVYVLRNCQPEQVVACGYESGTGVR